MDFFERWINFSADGGSGVLETAYAFLILLPLGLFAFRRAVLTTIRTAVRAIRSAI